MISFARNVLLVLLIVTGCMLVEWIVLFGDIIPGRLSSKWIRRDAVGLRRRCHEQYSTLDGEFLQFNRKVVQEPTYIFSAFRDFRKNSDEVVLSGASHKEGEYMCCFIHKDGSLFKEKLTRYVRRIAWSFGNRTNHYLSYQYMCPYDKTRQPKAVTITEINKECPSCNGDYKEILDPQQGRGKIAMCVPFLFGGIPDSHILEWMEYHKLFKVDKVYVYYLDDNQYIMNILAHYQEEGFVEIVMAELPGVVKGIKKRQDMYTKKYGLQYHADIQSCMNDCLMRTSGYSYVAVYDFDEFLVPVPGIFNIKTLVQGLFDEYPDAAGFTTISFIFPQEWNKTHPSSKLERLQYRRSVRDTKHLSKSIHMPMRTETRNGHYMYPTKGYKRYTIPTTNATLHHYRKCQGQYKEGCSFSKSSIDTRLGVIEQRWSDNVQATRNKLDRKLNAKWD